MAMATALLGVLWPRAQPCFKNRGIQLYFLSLQTSNYIDQRRRGERGSPTPADYGIWGHRKLPSGVCGGSRPSRKRFLGVSCSIFTVRRSALHGLSYRNSVRLSVCLSVRPSVCHTRGLCPHGSTYDHDFFNHRVAPSF